jgi:AcrR family transcriptional regulator
MKTAAKAPPTKQPDVTREKILDAAFQEIYRHGFQAASLNNILANTGLTKGALYHHFPNKDDLGHAVIEEVVREGLDAMVFAPLRDSREPFAELLDVIRAKAARTDADNVKLGCALNNLMQEMSPLDAGFKKRLNGVLTAWQEAVEEALTRAQKQGQVRREVDARAAALFIVSAWEGCVGVAKNLQSVRDFRLCMKQLEEYVQGLASAGRARG